MDEVVKDDGNPYKVYTPYSRKWIEKLNASGFETCKSETKLNSLAKIELPYLTLKEIGFDEKNLIFHYLILIQRKLKNMKKPDIFLT